MGLDVIYDTAASNTDGSCDAVDIVTIHGPFENALQTWKGDPSGKTWLEEVLDPASPVRRVFNFSYVASTSILLGEDAANNLLQTAHTLVADLEARRQLTNTSGRPIIFICHDLGGVIVKKALAFSATQVSNQVEHKYSIYISTYAIMFFGTPHFGYTKALWKWVFRQQPSFVRRHTDISSSMTSFDETLQNITSEFAPLVKQFHLYFFWEGKPSRLENAIDFVVSQESAGPLWDRTERCGIDATHSQMCKLDAATSPAFTVVMAAIKRYTSRCHATIGFRWETARKFLETQRSIEAQELVGFDVHESNKPFTYLNSPKYDRKEPSMENKYYFVPHNVSTFYTGWQAIAQDLQESLLLQHSPILDETSRVYVIYGLGGSGKTQCCLKFVHDYRKRFWAIFWLDVSCSDNAERDLARIGLLGGLGESYQAGISWLTALSMPWLLIFDNADDPTLDYSKYFPNGDKGRIIMTSRLQACKIHATAGSYELRQMHETDATALLLRTSGLAVDETEADKTSAQRIVKELGYLPLAITQAGASIRQNLCAIHQYSEIYASRKVEMMKEHFVQGTDQYKYTVYTTWEVSVQSMQREGTAIAADAVDILQTLAFFHFEQVCMNVFAYAWDSAIKGQNGATEQDRGPVASTLRFLVSLSRIIARRVPDGINDLRQYLPNLLTSTHLQWDALRFQRALNKLVDHSLIFQDRVSNIYSMHPLVHQWAQARLSDSDRQTWARCALNVLSASIASTANASNRSFRRDLIPHLDACLRHTEKTFDTLEQESDAAVEREVRFSNVYAENGHWRKAERLRQHVLGVRKSKLGSDHSSTLDIMTDLADGYWNLFDIAKALKFHKLVNQHGAAVYGPSDSRTLKSYDNLAKTMWLCGMTEAAAQLSEKTVSMMENHLGNGHPDTLTAIFNLARCRLHRGRPQEAEKRLIFVLEQRRKMLGERHLDTISAYAELGTTYYTLRRFDVAEDLMQRVVHERSRLLGSQHAYTLWAENDLAKVYIDQGRPQEGERVLIEVLRVATQTLGRHHIGTFMTMYNLARAYNGQEKWREGRNTLEELIGLQQMRLPPDHPDKLSSRLELAHSEKHLGNIEEAEGLLLDLIKDMNRTIGATHPHTRKAMGRLSAIYIDRGKLLEAEELDEGLRNLETKE